jgi:hypothetical protein
VLQIRQTTDAHIRRSVHDHNATLDDRPDPLWAERWL